MLSGSTSSPFFLLCVAVLRDSVLLSPESSSSVLAALNAELFAMRARRPCSSRSSKSDTLHDKNMGFYEMQSGTLHQSLATSSHTPGSLEGPMCATHGQANHGPYTRLVSFSFLPLLSRPSFLPHWQALAFVRRPLLLLGCLHFRRLCLNCNMRAGAGSVCFCVGKAHTLLALCWLFLFLLDTASHA